MTIVFQNARLIDGIGEAAREAVDVVVEGQQIAAVESHAPRNWAESGATVIPADGAAILPGLIDCHTHYTIDATVGSDSMRAQWTKPDAAMVLVAAHNARLALEAGVTTARSAGAQRNLDFALRDAICLGQVPGPRLLAAGMPVGITGGHAAHGFGYEVDGIVELVRAVRQQARDGADVVKIMASEAAMLTTAIAGVEELTLAEVEALVAEARRLRRRIFSHAQSAGAVITSARGGVDSVEHGFLANREALATLRECGTTLVPTLVVTDVYRDLPGLSTAQQARQREIERLHRQSCETAIALGVNVVTGTDTGVTGVMPNMLWREVWLLHDHGYSPMQAIQAATSRAAKLLGVDDVVGSIEPGKQADLIMVAGNPLADLRHLERPALVVQAGRIVARPSADGSQGSSTLPKQ